MLRSFEQLCHATPENLTISVDAGQATLAHSGDYAKPWHWHDCVMFILPSHGTLELRHEDCREGTWLSHDRFAVVPCCVFARIKQHRRLLRRRSLGGDEREAAGTERRRRRTTAVRTHEELCEYLMQRGGRGTKRSDLGFSGRPTVIYHLGNYADYDEPAVQPAFAFLSAGLQRASKCTKRT